MQENGGPENSTPEKAWFLVNVKLALEKITTSITDLILWHCELPPTKRRCTLPIVWAVEGLSYCIDWVYYLMYIKPKRGQTKPVKIHWEVSINGIETRIPFLNAKDSRRLHQLLISHGLTNADEKVEFHLNLK